MQRVRFVMDCNKWHFTNCISAVGSVPRQCMSYRATVCKLVAYLLVLTCCQTGCDVRLSRIYPWSHAYYVHAVTCVATETPKNVLKRQGLLLCIHPCFSAATVCSVWCTTQPCMNMVLLAVMCLLYMYSGDMDVDSVISFDVSHIVCTADTTGTSCTCSWTVHVV